MGTTAYTWTLNGVTNHYDSQGNLIMRAKIGGSDADATPEWKTGDRFQGTGSGRFGRILSVTGDEVEFQMDDDTNSAPDRCDRSLFEKHVRRIGAGGAAGSAPVSRAEAACTTCKRMNDVGVRVCWCCGGAPHAG